jgi:hypothetical protein
VEVVEEEAYQSHLVLLEEEECSSLEVVGCIVGIRDFIHKVLLGI